MGLSLYTRRSSDLEYRGIRRTILVLNQSRKENSDGSKEEVKPEFLQMFSVLDNVLDISAKVIAGGKAQTQELKRLYIEHKSREASEQTLSWTVHCPALMPIEL